MKTLAATAVLVFAISAGAASGVSRSGLRGKALIDPAFPVCRIGEPCTKPAKHVWLKFWRQGRIVARTRTTKTGKYRIPLTAGRTYRVTTSIRSAVLQPRRVKVRAGRYRRVIFRIDIGIR